MKEVIITKYKCDACGYEYGTKEACLECEKVPISEDKGVKVGDIVLVTAGQGGGCQAKVESVHVISNDWGPKYYHHTIAVNAKLIGGLPGNRYLCFTDYKVIV